MPSQTYKIAHIRKQRQNIIIMPMAKSFQFASQQDKDDTQRAIQACASQAGLAGTVCLVWEAGRNFCFKAPKPWHAFSSILLVSSPVLSAPFTSPMTYMCPD